MGSERREFERVPLPMPIRVHVMDDLLGTWLDGLVQDLSASGVRFTSPRPLEPDAVVEFQVTLPGRMEPYTLTGRVLWVEAAGPEEFECGAAFGDVSDGQRVFIDELVQFLKNRKG